MQNCDLIWCLDINLPHEISTMNSWNVCEMVALRFTSSYSMLNTWENAESKGEKKTTYDLQNGDTVDIAMCWQIIATLCNETYFFNKLSLQWHHNDHDGVSNHQPHSCLHNRLFRRRSKKTSKLRVTGLCVGNSPGPMNSPHKGPVT